MGLLDAQALTMALRTRDDLSSALTTYARSRRCISAFIRPSALGFTPFYQADGRLLPVGPRPHAGQGRPPAAGAALAGRHGFGPAAGPTVAEPGLNRRPFRSLITANSPELA